MRLIIVLMMAFFGLSSYTQTVAIPDENFEKALIEMGIDTDGEINGLIFKSDVLTVESLDISNKNINDLTGIEEFSSLIYLNCTDNKLSNLDLSQNISLLIVFSSIDDINRPLGYQNYLAWFDKW